MSKAQEREQNDDHLTQDERKELVEQIREEDDISQEVGDEQIYEEYIIE